ncbi:MAG: aldehyde dehydrogenase family protein [Phycisphaerales bacterium]|nr:aldehyde dehydrogenase family protein [Phycisphaerales bacterium]
MLRDEYPLYLAGHPTETAARLDVHNKYTGQPATRVALADRGTVEQAIAAAAAAFDQTRRLASFERQRILSHIVHELGERYEEFAHVLAGEVGKPIRDARVEVGRAIDTFRTAAEESVRIVGEYLPLDIGPRSAGCEAIVRRFPVGPCAFITPFNFPLNLAAHKIAPAIAVGCPWVLKPASATPVSSILLAEVVAESGWPLGAFSVLPCRAADAEPLVADERIAKLSFTGSPEVGWALKARAGRKRVTLELGGNAACIVDRDADLERAAERITFGAFYSAGQSCISVQRVLVHRDVYHTVRSRLVERAAGLRVGDPLDEQTFLGPLISEADARRVETWVGEAVRAGARVLCGGRRQGACYEPTYLENVPRDARVSCQEVFGPVATLEPFDDFKAAVAAANDSAYGLQAGVFTASLDHAFYAYNELQVGGVIINDVPSFRVDSMPYGGVKASGTGREGVRYVMEEMTERKVLVLRGAGGVQA